MPTIDRIRLTNLRSIGDASLEIPLGTRLTVLVGLNNSGKSNVLRGLMLILGTKNVAPIDNADINVSSNEAEVSYNYSLTEQELAEVRLNLEAIVRKYRGRHRSLLGDSRLESQLDSFIEYLFSQGITISRKIHRDRQGKPSFDVEPALFREIRSDDQLIALWNRMVINSKYANLRFLEKTVKKLVNETLPVGFQIPENLVPINTITSIPFAQLNGATPEELRDYLLKISSENTSQYQTIEKNIVDAFPEVSGVGVERDDYTGVTEFHADVSGKQMELGLQGNGFRRMIMLLSQLITYNRNLLVIDEPERHLHPKLEVQFVQEYTKLTKAQVVVATHSANIIGSINSRMIKSGEIKVYWLELVNGGTQANELTPKQVVKRLAELGVPPSRYLKHMVAHATTRIFVEGSTDEGIIRAALAMHSMEDELEKHNPYFVPYGGSGNFHKLSAEIIDDIAKSDRNIATSVIPYVVLADRDENDCRTHLGPNIIVLSVREIENIVLSKLSIISVAKKFFRNLGMMDSGQELSQFEENLKKSLRAYLPKLAKLKVYSKIINLVRRLTRRNRQRHVGGLEWSELRKHLEFERKSAELIFQEISQQMRAERVETLREDLEGSCFLQDGSLNYQYICQNVPGKDFIRLVLRKALIETGLILKPSVSQPDSPTEDRIEGEAGNLSNPKTILQFTTKLHPDLKRLLDKLREVTGQSQM